MKRAVYAGSFDPITNGHLWVIKRASGLFDELVVAIGINPEKKPTFSVEERIDMTEMVTSNLPNIIVTSFENKLLVDFAKSSNAKYIVRGIRNETDYAYERGMNQINMEINPEIETVFFLPDRRVSEISSSFIKGLIGVDGWKDVVRRYVPGPVFKKIVQKENSYVKN